MIKNIPVTLLIYSILLLTVNRSSAQSCATIASPSGNIFLITNLSRYSPGEFIIFRAYADDNNQKDSGTAGRKLFSALLDQHGNEKGNGVFALDNGKADGRIEIPSDLPPGNYLLIACTGPVIKASPSDIFTKIIKVENYEKRDFSTEINLTDTIYKPNSESIIKLRFAGNEGNPIAVSFDYQLYKNSENIISGKGKTDKSDTVIIRLDLPDFTDGNNIKLIVTASYKGYKKITAIVFPTYHKSGTSKIYSADNFPAERSSILNIKISTGKKLYLNNENIESEILVTDSTGKPVAANLSVSCINTGNNSFRQDEIIHPALYNDMNNMQIQDITPVLNVSDNPSESEKGKNTSQVFPLFSESIRQLFAGNFTHILQTPGCQFDLPLPSGTKKYKSWSERQKLQDQEGYSPERDIFDIIRQIKPYYLAGDKIIFTSSGIGSVNYQDGALIVIDGINSGTDARILNTVAVSDIAKIAASTNAMDIQRYSAMNSTGVIEIYTKKGVKRNTVEVIPEEKNNDSLFWQTDIRTDNAGKARIRFRGNKSSRVIILVAGISAGGQAGGGATLINIK